MKKIICGFLAMLLLAACTTSFAFTTSAVSSKDYVEITSLDISDFSEVDDNTLFAYITEEVSAASKLKLRFSDDYDSIRIFVKKLDGQPDFDNSNEKGELLVDKNTSRDYYTISKANMRDCDQAWVKISVQGSTKTRSGTVYSPVTNYYLYVGDPSAKEYDYPTIDDRGNTFVEYDGVDYIAALQKLYAEGIISATEYANRCSLLEEARYACTLIWEAPYSFHSWRGSDGSFNSNRSMYVSGNKNNVYFKAGGTYVGIPYCAKAGSNTAGVDQWITRLASATSSASLEGTAEYLEITRKETTIFGVDCSGLVYRAYCATSNHAKHISTTSMLTSAEWTKIDNKKDLRPGDILVKKGHVMIFVGYTENGYCAVFESAADGENGYSGCRYFVHKDVSQYQARRYNKIDA